MRARAYSSPVSDVMSSASVNLWTIVLLLAKFSGWPSLLVLAQQYSRNRVESGVIATDVAEVCRLLLLGDKVASAEAAALGFAFAFGLERGSTDVVELIGGFPLPGLLGLVFFLAFTLGEALASSDLLPIIGLAIPPGRKGRPSPKMDPRYS